MPNCIQIIQWREPFDDEDCLSVYAYPDGIETDGIEDIREEFDIELPDDPEDVDTIGCVLVSNDYTLWDGATVEHKGLKFRVTITEITE